ncbi:hypothetical protein EV1_038603 [Malus domestica]
MPLMLDIKQKFVQRIERVKSLDLYPSEPWILASLSVGKVRVSATKSYITFQGAGKDATVIEWHDRASDPGPNGQQFRTYQNAFHGVAAQLNEQETERLEE